MNQNRHTVLVVNDSPDQLELSKFILEQADYRVMTASSGNEGIEVIRRDAPDLVVSDVTMPDGNGIQLCRAIRADERFRTLPILLVSALRKDTASIIEGLDVGADDYLEAPFDPVHLVARVARLSERKRTEDVLSEKERYFRSLIENVSDVLSILSGEGVIYYQSPSIEQVLGYEPESLLGKNALDFIHPDDLAKVLLYFNRTMRRKHKSSPAVEYRFRHGDGLWRVLESVGNLIDDPNKGMVAVINSRDVSVQKRAETALRESEKKFRKVLEHSRDIIYQLNLETKSFDYMSPAIKEISGYEAEEFIEGGFSFSNSRVHPDDLPLLKKRIAETLMANRTENEPVEYRLLTKEKGYRWVSESRTVVRGEQNEPVSVIAVARDITAQKQTEAALRFQKTLLESQSEASIEGILFVAGNGEIVSYNRRFQKMWEIPDQILKTNSNEAALKFVLSKVENSREFIDTVNYLYEHPDQIHQAEIPLKNGRILERYTAPVRDDENTHYGRVWFFRDITERKNVETAIRFQVHLLDTVEEAVIATDLDGIVVYWNKFAQKLYGWSAAEAVNCSIMNLTTPETSIEEGRAIMARLSKGESWSGEFTVKTKEKNTFPALVTNAPIYDEKKTLIGIVGVSKDITEQKQAETALIEANERAIRQYNSLLQRLAKLGETVGIARDLNAVFTAVLEFARVSAPCSALIISLYEEKSKMRKVVYCWYNGAEMDVSKLEPVPVGKGIVGQVIKTGEVAINNDYFNAVRKRSANVSFGFDEDERMPQSSIIAPMKIKGGSIGVIEVQSYEPGVYGDEHATAMSMAANFIANAIENVRLLELERQREEQLRQSQKLESVGRLAGGIAHDFNNMLTAINGYSSLTLRRLKPDDPLRRNIEEIKKAGERSAALTHQLLAFSRKQVLKPKILDINQTVNDINFMLNRLIGEDVQLISALSSELGQVEVDPGQLSQVIMNLAVNARDAMPNGGTLTIETSNVYLDEEFAARHVPTQAGHYVMLAVTDNGTGIAPETRQHIFEPFFTTKEVGKGTGLGLATVYGIVKQSGGYIWVESKLGQGSTFNIYLPRVDERADVEKKQSAPEELAAGTETILLVEDEQMVRNLTRQILEDCGYAVLEAANGVEALEICGQNTCKIDLLMTDVVMPQMGGRELAEKLAATHPLMKVLFTSGYTDDSTLRHGVIEAGTNFIQKPFSPASLALKVRNILDAG